MQYAHPVPVRTPLASAIRLMLCGALLAAGATIVVPDALAPCGRGVDTPADLERLRRA